MGKNTFIIGPGHSLYSDVDDRLRAYGKVRFDVRLNRYAKRNFRKLAKALSESNLPHGALLMLGYNPANEEMKNYFVFGVNPDMAKTPNLVTNFDETLETTIERAMSPDKHDGAFLFSPDGILHHSGAKFDHWSSKVIESFNYSDYYSIKRKLGIQHGGTRIEAAIVHSLLFHNALFASISETEGPLRDCFIENNKVYLIRKYYQKFKV